MLSCCGPRTQGYYIKKLTGKPHPGRCAPEDTSSTVLPALFQVHRMLEDGEGGLQGNEASRKPKLSLCADLMLTSCAVMLLELKTGSSWTSSSPGTLLQLKHMARLSHWHALRGRLNISWAQSCWRGRTLPSGAEMATGSSTRISFLTLSPV